MPLSLHFTSSTPLLRSSSVPPPRTLVSHSFRFLPIYRYHYLFQLLVAHTRKVLKMSSALERLPAELRFSIWNIVGEQEHFVSLMKTSSLIRDDILCGTPGALLSCNCPYNRPCRCGRGFEIERLALIVDCQCSDQYWLKFYVYPQKKSTPFVWSIADLDAPFAQVLRYYRPRETTIEFRLVKEITRFNNTSYIVLRAKLFDVCEILAWFQPQRERHLRIHFAEPPSFPTFWHLVVAHNVGFNTYIWDERDQRREGIDRELWAGHNPCIYETLLMPLILNSNWRNSEVTFDGDAEKYSSFYFFRESHGTRVEDFRFDHELLRVTAWAYMDRLITDGAVKRDDDDLTPYFEQYDRNAEIWDAEKPRRRKLQAAFHSCLLAAIETGFCFDLLVEDHSIRFGTKDDHLESLRSHIRRTRNLSSSNAFSKDHPNTEAPGWLWNLDPFRQALLIWAEKDPEKWLFDWDADLQAESSFKLRYIRWRAAHTPLWPKSWPRNWPPLKKKALVELSWMPFSLGFKIRDGKFDLSN